jgi:hypothetical protein
MFNPGFCAKYFSFISVSSHRHIFASEHDVTHLRALITDVRQKQLEITVHILEILQSTSLFFVLETGGIDAEHLEIANGSKMVSSASGRNILDLCSKA